MNVIIGFVFALFGLRVDFLARSERAQSPNIGATDDPTMLHKISPTFYTSTVAGETSISSSSSFSPSSFSSSSSSSSTATAAASTAAASTTPTTLGIGGEGGGGEGGGGEGGGGYNLQLQCPLHCSCSYANKSSERQSTTRHLHFRRFYRDRSSTSGSDWSDDLDLKVSCRYAGFDVPPLSIPLESTHIDLTGNRLLSGSLALLRDCRSLRQLTVAECHVRNVADMTLGGHDWFLTISSLDASRNRIVYLHNSSFLKMPFLQLLNLSHNRIELIHKEAFVFLDGLSVLDLSGNRLSSFSDSSWCYTVGDSLEFLDMSGNNIHTVSNVPLRLLKRLSRLNVSSNHIRNVHQDTFADSRRLEVLRLSDNMLENLPVLDGRLESLRLLDLSGNNFRILARNSFANISRLESILLNGNPSLLVVDESSFANLSSLRLVQLNDNDNLVYVDRSAFVDLPNLETLEMRGGSLETVEEELILSLPRLTNLDVSMNPLRCDCVTGWMAGRRGKEGCTTTTTTSTITSTTTSTTSTGTTYDSGIGSSVEVLLSGNRTASLNNCLNTSCLLLNNENNTCRSRIIAKLFPNEVRVKMADPLLVYCVAVGVPSPASHWSRRKNGSAHELEIHGKRLEIKSATLEDQGTYRCTSDSTSSEMKLSVERLNASLVLLRLTDTSVTLTWKHLDHSRDYRIHFKMVFDKSPESAACQAKGQRRTNRDSNGEPVHPIPESANSMPSPRLSPPPPPSSSSPPSPSPSSPTFSTLEKVEAMMTTMTTTRGGRTPTVSTTGTLNVFHAQLLSGTYDQITSPAPAPPPPPSPLSSTPTSSSSPVSSPSSSSSPSPLATSSSSSSSSSSSPSTMVDIKHYMRMFTANDLTPGCKYEFCIALKLSEGTYHTVSCSEAVTKLPSHQYAIGFRNVGPTLIVVCGLMFCLFILIFTCGLGLTRRYDRRQVKRRVVTDDQTEANSSELYLAASVKENTMATEVYFENDAIVSSPDRCSPVFNQADIDEIWDSINRGSSEGRGYCESSFVSEPWRQDFFAGGSSCCLETTCRNCGSKNSVVGGCVLSPLEEIPAKDSFQEVLEDE